MNITILIVFIVILFIGFVVLALIVRGGSGQNSLDQEKFRKACLTIEQSVSKDNPQSWTLAVFNADKLLDQALKQSGVKGDTMGARMKNAQTRWSNANNVWTAHKLRNRLAHETDSHIDYDLTRRALAAYRQGLKDLGAV